MGLQRGTAFEKGHFLLAVFNSKTRTIRILSERTRRSRQLRRKDIQHSLDRGNEIQELRRGT